MNRALMERTVEGHEGRRASVYRDSRGILTAAIGCNLEEPSARDLLQGCGADYDAVCNGSVALTEEQIDEIFERQLSAAIFAAQCQVRNFDELPDGAQAVVVDMMFNLGSPRFAEFVHLKAALAARDFKAAAAEIRDSKWCGQVKTRCADNAEMMERAI